MMAPSIVTIAGRHAADQARHREALLRAERELLQDLARDRLARVLARRGLNTRAHLDPELDTERTIWVECRGESRAADHQLVYAVLDELEWRTDHARLSRINAHYDVLRLGHGPTEARVALIVKIPTGAVIEWEAA